MATNYFPRKSESAPMIYAYEDKYAPYVRGLLKVGYTTIGVQERVRQQYNIVRPGEPPYRILVEESAMRQDGTSFLDHDVHRALKKMGCQQIEGEWYRCTPQQVRAAVVAVSAYHFLGITIKTKSHGRHIRFPCGCQYFEV